MHGHRLDDGFLTADFFRREVLVFHRLRDVAHAGDFFEDFVHVNELHLVQLFAEVVEVEGFAFRHLGGEFARFCFVHLVFEVFDEAEDVAHAEDARGDAVGVEGFECVGFFANAEEFDRFAGDVADGECRATACVTVDFREDDAGQRQYVVKGFGGVGGVLTGHAVHHEEGFDRVQQAVQVADFVHQRVVNVQATGGIDDEDVHLLPLGGIQRTRGDVSRFFAGFRGDEDGADLFGQGFQLLYRRRAVHVGGNEADFFLVVNKFFREFGAGGGFAGALQACQEDDGGRLSGEVEGAVFFAHDAHQLALYGFNKGLVGREFQADFLTDGGVFDGLDDFLDDWQGNVGFDQRHAHITQHLADVVFGDAGLAAQFFECALQAFAEIVKHGG